MSQMRRAMEMRGMRRVAIFLALAVLLLLAFVAIVHPDMSASAQLDPDYDLSWWTVDNGGAALCANGGTLHNEGYLLRGTIGQPDVALAPYRHSHTLLIGDGYALMGGFWLGAVAVSEGHFIYLPLVVRNDSTR
jgi:hypothetical protein